MSLASVIRMEFAYPGVGVLAGDSIQYLSIATAHGVIMVFFMVMPAIFGAFGNFLLPTQLGVHDVAFPRLNSAAFWFLPGGLIMLCQLVCVDRKYQRMNCFNIREIQGILKRKFFTDLVNTSDSRLAMDSTLIGIRHRNNMSNILLYDQSLFYNFDLTNSSKYKSFFIGPVETYSYSPNNLLNNSVTTLLNTLYQFIGLSLPNLSLNQTIKDLLFFLYSPVFNSLITLTSSFSYLKYNVITTLFIPSLPLYLQVTNNLKPVKTINVTENTSKSYISTTHNYNDLISSTKFSFSDNSST
jgi:hypothetical protein